MNRITRWCDDGFGYEADPRQAEKLTEDLVFAGTLGVKCSQSMIDDDVLWAIDRHTHFRGVAARASYLSADRPD